MRRVLASSLMVALALGASVASGQSADAGRAHYVQGTHPTAAAVHHHRRHRRRHARRVTTNQIKVLNGTQWQTVTFAAPPSTHGGHGRRQAADSTYQVEVINGSQHEMKTFTTQQVAESKPLPKGAYPPSVVTKIEDSTDAPAQPVVTGVDSSANAQGNAVVAPAPADSPKVVDRVAPNAPKRKPYQSGEQK